MPYDPAVWAAKLRKARAMRTVLIGRIGDRPQSPQLIRPDARPPGLPPISELSPAKIMASLPPEMHLPGMLDNPDAVPPPGGAHYNPEVSDGATATAHSAPVEAVAPAALPGAAGAAAAPPHGDETPGPTTPLSDRLVAAHRQSRSGAGREADPPRDGARMQAAALLGRLHLGPARSRHPGRHLLSAFAAGLGIGLPLAVAAWFMAGPRDRDTPTTSHEAQLARAAPPGRTDGSEVGSGDAPIRTTQDGRVPDASDLAGSARDTDPSAERAPTEVARADTGLDAAGAVLAAGAATNGPSLAAAEPRAARVGAPDTPDSSGGSSAGDGKAALVSAPAPLPLAEPPSRTDMLIAAVIHDSGQGARTGFDDASGPTDRSARVTPPNPGETSPVTAERPERRPRIEAPRDDGTDNPDAHMAAPAQADPAALPEHELTLFAPSRVPSDHVGAVADALRASGAHVVEPVRTRLTIQQTNIRYYHATDAGTARALAESIGAEARDFTSLRPAPPPGRLELWMAGSGTATAARAPRADDTLAEVANNLGSILSRLVSSIPPSDPH